MDGTSYKLSCRDFVVMRLTDCELASISSDMILLRFESLIRNIDEIV